MSGKDVIYLFFTFMVFMFCLYKYIKIKIDNKRLKEKINELNMELIKYKGKFWACLFFMVKNAKE